MNIENELNNLKYKIIRSKEVSLEFKKEIEKNIDSIKEQLILSGVVKSLNATYKKGDKIILDTGLKAEILGFKNNLAIVLDERGLKFYKQLHKIKHQ